MIQKPIPPVTIDDVAKEYYLDHPRLKIMSLYNLGRLVIQFNRWAGGQANVEHLNVRDAEAFIRWLLDVQGFQQGTVSRFQISLITLWRAAIRNGWTEHTPDGLTRIALPKRPPPRPWTDAELQALLRAAKGCHGWFDCGIPRAAFCRAVLRLYHCTGLTFHELTALRVTQLDGDRLVSGGREFTLSGETLAALRDTFAEYPDRDLLLPWDNTPRAFYNYLERIASRAGIPIDRRWPIWKKQGIKI